ncbi:MAG: OmpA family protein [Luteimonas sp.]
MNTSSFAMPVAMSIAVLLSACATAPPPQPHAPPPSVTQNQKLSADSLFAFGKSSLDSLSDSGRAQLDALAASLLGGAPFEMIHVIGHSDRIGNDKANLDLSTRRANSVRDYLVRSGVPANRITAVGRGSVEPIVQCDDKARQSLIDCLAPNRRVDIRVIAAQ